MIDEDENPPLSAGDFFVMRAQNVPVTEPYHIRGRRLTAYRSSGRLNSPQRIAEKMIKQGLFILLLSTAAADAADNSDKLSVNLAGIGSRTCAYWLSSQPHKAEGMVWIYGFWSGLNYVAAASEQDQSKASSAAFTAAVEGACRRAPSRVLAIAAWSAYVEFNKN